MTGVAQFEKEWTAWCRRFDDSERGVYTLFHVRWMWRVVEGISRHAHPDGYTELDNYLARTAIDSLALGVRREIDRDERTSSVAHVLERLIREPRMASRERYVEGVGQEAPEDARDADRWFDAYAEPGDPYISVDRVQADIDRLKAAAGRVKTFVDEQVAHRQLEEQGRIDPTEIDRALGEIRRVVLRYHGLRWPGQLLLDTTPIADRGFLQTFTKPWLSIEDGIPEWLTSLHDHDAIGQADQ